MTPKTMFSAGALTLAVVASAAPAFSLTLQDVEKKVESNLARIKTVECEVEVSSVMPMGSLQQRFRVVYKYPYLYKAISIDNPALVYIARKDTAYFKGPKPANLGENLVAMIRVDEKGRLFNPASLLRVDSAGEGTPCGKRVCFGFAQGLPATMAGKLPAGARVTQVTGTFEYSPKEGVIRKFTVLAGPAVTMTEMDYQSIGGIKVPTSIQTRVSTLTATIRFVKYRLNQPISDEEFR